MEAKQSYFWCSWAVITKRYLRIRARYSLESKAMLVCSPISEATLPCLTSPKAKKGLLLLLFVGCLTSQQHASVSQGRICSDNFTCCHTETEVADQCFISVRMLQKTKALGTRCLLLEGWVICISCVRCYFK